MALSRKSVDSVEIQTINSTYVTIRIVAVKLGYHC